MIINQFDTNNETNEKKENMTRKSIIPKDEYQSYKNDFDKEILNKKTTTETINIFNSTSEILVTYALIYSKLNNEGKKMAQQQLRKIGEDYDKMQNIVKFKTYLKAKNKGVK